MEKHARIDLSPEGGGVVELGGVDVSRATRALQVNAAVGARPQLILDLALHEVILDGAMEVRVPKETAAVLVLMGWTPPPTS